MNTICKIISVDGVLCYCFMFGLYFPSSMPRNVKWPLNMVIKLPDPII